MIKVYFNKGRGQHLAPFLYNSKQIKIMAAAKKFKAGRPLEFQYSSYRVGEEISEKDLKTLNKAKIEDFVGRGVLVPTKAKAKKKK